MTIQANQGFGVSVFGAVSSSGGGGGGTPGGLNTQVQFNSSGSFGASANLTFVSPALTIGTQQTTQGQIVFANTAAGAFATTVQSSNSASAAWTLTLPATAGTANYALTTNGSGVSSWSQISLTAGVTGTLPLANGGTNANLTASNGGIVYSGASAFAVLAGTATAGQMLRSGASGAPSWSTATFPSTATSTGTILRADGTNWVATTATYPTTTTSGQILYSTATNTVGGSSTLTWNGSTFNISSASAFMPQILNFNSAADQYGPYVLFQKSRSASAVQVNDFLGTFVFKGYDSNGVAQNSSSFYASVTAVAAGSVDSAMSILSSGSTGYLVLGATSEVIRITPSLNALLGTTTNPTTGTKCLTIGSGTAPTASPADSITLYSSDLSAGNTMLSYYTEGTSVNANTTAAATHRIAIRVNGTVYYVLANTAA